MAKAKKEQVEIPALNEEVIEVPIRALDGPLVVHNWSKKAIVEMLANQMHQKVSSKAAKNPEEQFRDSLYVATDDSYGFPAVAFKAAMVRAAKMIDGLEMTATRQMVFVVPDCQEDREFEVPLDPPFIHGVKTPLVRIFGEPEMRMDMVKLNGKTADIRFRGSFSDWFATLTIRYMADAVSAVEVANLVNIAGHTVGVGEGRPEKGADMTWGRWEVATK